MDAPTINALLPGPVGPSRTTEPTAAETNAATADFESFLKLLTTQLENQDPLSPLDATEFVAQLASFSSVEQLVGVNDKLEAMSSRLAAADVAGLAAWIGRDATLTDGLFRASGEPVAFSYAPPVGDQIVRARVVTPDGTELTEFPVRAGTPGSGEWNGRTLEGAQVIGRDVKILVDYIEGGTVQGTEIGAVSRTITAVRGGENGLVLDFADGGSARPEDVAGLSSATAR